MRDAVRWLGYLLLTLMLIVAVLFAAYRWRGPSQAQREAVATVEKNRRPDHGVNAFALFWFMSYDVPDDQFEARLAEDIAAVRKRLAASDAPLGSYEPTWKKLPEAGHDPKALCAIRDAGCLAKVAADLDGARRAIAGFPRTLARDAAFEQTDFYWDDFPPDFRASLVAYPGNAQRVWLTAYAVKYEDGDRVGAMADVCANIGTWRRLHRGTNSLVEAMFAIPNVDGGLRLFAEMLARLPQDETVPDACGKALEPIAAADVDRCAEMAGEFRLARSTIERALPQRSTGWERVERWLVYEPRQSEGWRAEQYAAFCGEQAAERMMHDVPWHAEGEAPVTRRLECIASVTGCILADIARPIYGGYDERTLDCAAHLRLAATLLWLRQQHDPNTAGAFDRRPDALRTSRRKSGFDAENNSLFVANMDVKKGDVFALPVAASGRRESGSPAPTSRTTNP